MPPAARPVARLTSPGEIAQLVPVLCGFVPHESLVVVSLRGPRKRVGMTMRFDLDWLRDGATRAVGEVAGRLALDRAEGAVVVVVSEQAPDATDRRGGRLPWAGLVEQVVARCEEQGTAVVEALLVQEGRWWSFLCHGQACCPAEGTAVEAEPTPALRLLASERVLEGRVVLASREELARSLAPPVLMAAAAADQHLDQALLTWVERRREEGVAALRARGLAAARRMLTASLTPGGVSAAEAAQLAVSLLDVHLRDEIATWALTRPGPLLAMLLQVARQVVPPEDAQVCALLGWVAYAKGDGALANVALERALGSDPDCSLAQLLSQMLHRQIAPEEVRRLLAETRADLRDRA